ncbi:MAG: hypothetical protein IKK00_06900 [Oscillospiraceae bacterium]|nr:hypothetical protein [Oscillospiraceae bacterium]
MEGNRIEKRTDLLRGVTLTRLDRLFAEGDKGAHKFVIGLTLGNSVVTLDSGATVTGHFIRADDSTLPPIKGTVEEGKAVLTLPEGAYKITGYFSLIIKANVGEMSCAVFWGDGAITRTSTDTIVDPDHTIPSLDELLTKIAAVDDAIARADAAAEEARQAAQSANFKVLDRFDTYDQLIAAHPTGEAGQAFAVGTADDNVVYIWGIDTLSWVNIGPVQGAQGPKGDKPIKGVDYFTASDKTEIVNAVIAALPEAEEAEF